MSGASVAIEDPPLRPTRAAHRINTLATRIGAKRYLEIGVQHGHTFRAVEMAERVAVDPNFRFDTAKVANAATTLHAMPSDRYFAEQAGAGAFDIVFIDGLHVFEQVVRDLTNTLAWTHRRSAIVIDDTVPNDVFSTHTRQGEALRYRAEAGGKGGGAWHGDVFKIVFLIHDFFPFLDYRTIEGPGNPQTLAWHAPGTPRKPLLNSLERISRLTWFDLQNHRQVMRLTPEQEAIDICAAALGAA